MKSNHQIFKLILIALALLYSFQLHAEIHPVLFKDHPDLYSKVYFGMGFEEFKAKSGSDIIECKEPTNKNLADNSCKVSFRFSDSDISEAVILFKDGLMVAVAGKFKMNFYRNITSALSAIYKDQPQVETRDEKKGFFSKKISNEYSIWKYPDYCMLVEKFDVNQYQEYGDNYLYAFESANNTFVNKMQVEAKTKSNINIITGIAKVDISRLNLPVEPKINAHEKKNEIPVAKTEPQPATQVASTGNVSAVNNSEGYVPADTSNTPKPVEPKEKVTNLTTAIQPTTPTASRQGITNRALLPSNLGYGSNEEQLKDKVTYCSSNDKFLTEFRKSFPKYGVDEYCVGNNLVKDIQADTVFLLKDSNVVSIIHRTDTLEFRKLSNLYTTTFNTEPKNKKQYKSTVNVECFSDTNLQDYVEFCKQQGRKYHYFLASDSSTNVSNAVLNRTKLMGMLNTEGILSVSNKTSDISFKSAQPKSSFDANGTEDKKVASNRVVPKQKKVWDQEPTSFLGIKFGDPLTSSMNECGSNSSETCYYIETIGQTKFLHIGKANVEKFREIFISTLGNDDHNPYSRVGRIEVSFNTDDFDEVKEILVQKYGKPHSDDVGIVKTVGGAQFNNYKSYWLGDNVSVVIESLATRGYTPGRYGYFYSYGSLLLTTKEYLQQRGQEQTNKAKEAADKL